MEIRIVQNNKQILRVETIACVTLRFEISWLDLSWASISLRRAIALCEKPHCGNAGVPFMKRQIDFSFKALSIFVFTFVNIGSTYMTYLHTYLHILCICMSTNNALHNEID